MNALDRWARRSSEIDLLIHLLNCVVRSCPQCSAVNDERVRRIEELGTANKYLVFE